MRSSCCDYILFCIITTLFQTTFLQERERQIGYKYPYRMENLSARRDKETVVLFSDERRHQVRACATMW